MPTPTPKQLRGNQRRRLRAMANRLRDMAAEWGDLDEGNMSELDQCADKVDRTADELYASEDE